MWGAAPWRRSPRRMTAQSGSLRRRSGSGRRRSWGALRPWQHRSFRYPRRRESSPTPTSWPPDTTDAKESTDVPEANAEMKPGALELSEEARGRLAELRSLSEKAEAGDKQARKELRLMVRASSEEVIGRASDVGRKMGQTLAHTASGGDPLTEEALYAKLDLMRAEIAGEDPTPLEVLLTERVVALWMLTTLLEVLLATQYRKNVEGGPERLSPSYLIQQSRILESATRRYLAAIRELARVRKLQATAPPVHLNTQVNLL